MKAIKQQGTKNETLNEAQKDVRKDLEGFTMQQRVRKLMATLLVLAMCLGFAAPAFAAGQATMRGAAKTSTAGITKKLVVPYGTTCPTITFTFTVTPIDKDGAVFTPGNPNVPVIGTATADTPTSGEGTFTTAFNASSILIKVPTSPSVGNPGDPNAVPPVPPTPNTWYTENPDQYGNCTYYVETPDIFTNPGLAVNWDDFGAGVYKYTIAETGSNWTQHSATTDGYVDYLITDQTNYTMLVYVSRDATTGACSITHIGVVVTTPGTIDENTPKKDPTVGGDQQEYFTSQMEFKNTYWKSVIKDPADGGIFNVSKKTQGDLSDPQRYFDFSMTLTAPASSVTGTNAPTSTRAYIQQLNAAGTAWVYIDGTEMAAATGNKLSADGADTYGDYHIVNYGSAFTFALKHNQRLVFAEVAAGSTYTVTDFAVPGYFPNVTVTYNGGGTPGAGPNAFSTSSTVPSTSKNYTLTIPSQDYLGVGGVPNGANGKLFVGEVAPNSAAFVNDRGTVSIIGIDVNDMPFVGLIALAIGGVVVYAVLTSKRKSRYSVS